jgi:hypothetical protein
MMEFERKYLLTLAQKASTAALKEQNLAILKNRLSPACLCLVN